MRIEEYVLILKTDTGKPVESISEKGKLEMIRLFKSNEDAALFLLNIGYGGFQSQFKIMKLSEYIAFQPKEEEDKYEGSLYKYCPELGAQLDRLIASGAIINWGFENTAVLTLVTSGISIEYEGKTYNLGNCKIVLPLVRDEFPGDRIYIYSLKNEGRYFIHPHIPVEGHVMCYGNMFNTLKKYYEEKDYYTVVIVLLELLRSYNPKSCHIKLEHFRSS